MSQFEWNFLPPGGGEQESLPWMAGSIGTNILLYKTLVQNDIIVNFGSFRVQDPDKEIEEKKIVQEENDAGEMVDTEIVEKKLVRGETKDRFLLNVTDSVFVSLNTKMVGLRAGLSGSLGLFSGVTDSINIFLNLSGLAGVHILPESLFSFTIDVRPGYTAAVFYDMTNSDFFKAFSARHGWTFPIAVGVRINLDKL
jgi:hypothetical protein